MQFVYMPHPVPNPVNLTISHTFLQTMYRCSQNTERLGQIFTRVMLCGQHTGLDYDKQKRTITCQLKPIISIRLQLQVNTCHTLGAVLVCMRRWHTLLVGFISS